MSDETKALGNEEPGAGEPQAGETQDEQAPDSQESPSGKDAQDAEYWKREALRYKGAQEELNRLKRQAQEAPTPPPVAAGEWQPQPGTYEYFLAQGDPVAVRQYMNEVLQDQLDEIPVEDRPAVKKTFRENRARYGDYAAAYQAVKAARYADEVEELRQKNEEALKRLAALEKGPDPEVVRNSPPVTREISARERKSRDMTERELYAEAARIEQEGGYVARLNFLKGLEGPNPAIRLKE